ncbi:hypothetical protein JZO70_05945 [Enterococcus sp. 669A]|uniref:Uncharacterized protein n=1 Tax=Candidatus Enterococcus moelleringii TaxID=2815325 RepID=A0ABS3L7V3_9ENTE|nr:hypothetical protein [Enterococcus sp. 669A]MBO1305690.1 hypothetical protein [Enterococcus sp. 669A]
MSKKRKERTSTVLTFLGVIVMILVTTKFDAMPTEFNSTAVFCGLGLMLGTLLHYFKQEDKRSSDVEGEEPEID